jgi:hypothetical protein
MSKWQPIETYPEGKEVLCYWPNGEIQVGQIYRGKWQNDWISKSEDWYLPSHWMPLPEPPK